jgi:deoxycytidylate deaminase
MEPPVERGPEYKRQRKELRDRINLGHAYAEAEMAICVRRHVGAVIVGGTPPRILGTGYNGTGPGKPHCSFEEKGCERGLRTKEEVPPGGDYNQPGWRCSGIHAEHNAVLQAIEAVGKAALRGATSFCTDEPCMQCAVLLDSLGIQVVTRQRLMEEYGDDRDPKHVEHNKNLYPVDDPPVCERRGCGHVLASHWDPNTRQHTHCRTGCGCWEPLKP